MENQESQSLGVRCNSIVRECGCGMVGTRVRRCALTVDEILLNIGQGRGSGGSLLEVSAGERLCVQMLRVPEGGDRQPVKT